jgi:uncharacterized membrane protein YfcA
MIRSGKETVSAGLLKPEKASLRLMVCLTTEERTMVGIGASELALLVPIVAIVLGIGVAFWAIYWGHQTKKLEYEERRAMIEKGITPPPIPTEAQAPPKTPEQSFRSGIILLFLGVGLGIGYFILRNSFDDGPPPWTVGTAAAIVGALGVANLVYYFLRKDHPPETFDRK